MQVFEFQNLGAHSINSGLTFLHASHMASFLHCIVELFYLIYTMTNNYNRG